ncbi:MAG: MBL fold metallo-hydrolase [Clostridia bacterium]|nr:MBL fold metallo-hydrolase [Clostridia bacterium]
MNKKIRNILSVILIVTTLLCFLCGCNIEGINYYNDEYYSQESDAFNGDLRVHFLDIGQGDCALVETSDGYILIDAGETDSKDPIIEYIDSMGITQFEYAIFTHPHSDHIGSASTLLEKYTFNNVILPNAVSTTKIYEKLLDAVETEGCEVILGEAGKSFTLGDALIEIFAPTSDYDADDLNNMSIVAKLTYGDVSFLFTGDAEKKSEKAILSAKYDVSADVLKVGHHGSNTSSCEEFLNAVAPTVAVISAGEDNEYGHPHSETVQRLDELKADMYVTYEVGNIVISTDGVAFGVSTEK